MKRSDLLSAHLEQTVALREASPSEVDWIYSARGAQAKRCFGLKPLDDQHGSGAGIVKLDCGA